MQHSFDYGLCSGKLQGGVGGLYGKARGLIVSCGQTLTRGEKESGPLMYNVLFSVPPGEGM